MGEGGRSDITVAIARPAVEVAGYARDPRHLPAWAAGLAGGIEQVDGRWVADSPMGLVEMGASIEVFRD